MWDGTPPRGARGQRAAGDGMSSRRYDGTPPPPPHRPAGPPRRSDDPYRPFGESTGNRLPVPYQRGTLGTFNRLPSADYALDGPEIEDETEPPRHRVGFAIFHDGNPGHLWRGSVASTFGEAVISAGVIMWLATLAVPPLVIALAIASLGAPFVLAGPLAVRFEGAAEPGALLRWIGRLRIVFALALIPMQFRTVLPIVYLLLFAISFCGRLHNALRVAVIRTCLARGEPEQVANDMHIGSALAAVLGPLLGTLCFILVGERILLVTILAATIFLISFNSERFLDTLPPNQRDFLLATPEFAMSGDEWSDALALNEDLSDPDEMGPEGRREHALPAWYQLGPSSAFQAIGEIRAGLSLAGVTQSSAVALWGLCALGIAGGGLAVLEVFYLVQTLSLPPFYLGPLLAAEGAGLACGALLSGGSMSAADGWHGRFLAGVGGSGIALLLLVLVPMLPLAVAIWFALGVCNALAVQAARQGLLSGASGIQRRALTAAENALVALCSVMGTLLLVICYGSDVLPVHLPFSLAGLSVGELIVFIGGGLIVAAFVFALLLSMRSRAGKERTLDSSGRRLPTLRDDDEDDYLPAAGEYDAWEESGAREWTSQREDVDDFEASYGYQRTGYSRAAAQDAYDDQDTDYQDDDEGDEPPSRRGGPVRRPHRQNPPPRW